MESALAWRVEETEFNAWPALREIYLDGWVLRFSPGVSRRANSVNPLRFDIAGDDALISECERHYRRHRQPTLFRIVSIADPQLVERLAARGYTAEGETLTLYGPIEAAPAEPDPAVALSPRPTVRWCAAMAALQGHAPAEARTYRRIVGRIAVPAAFAMLTIEGEPAALAYGTVHNRLLCYESVVTAPAQRRRGYARQLLATLTSWGKAQGASGLCLQMQASSAAAIPLYHSIGLTTELYRYHYRRAPG